MIGVINVWRRNYKNKAHLEQLIESRALREGSKQKNKMTNSLCCVFSLKGGRGMKWKRNKEILQPLNLSIRYKKKDNLFNKSLILIDINRQTRWGDKNPYKKEAELAQHQRLRFGEKLLTNMEQILKEELLWEGIGDLDKFLFYFYHI